MKETSPVAAPSTLRRVLVPLLLIAVALTVYLSDQLVKNWVVATLPEGQSVPVLGEFLQWHFVRNPGAAFSFASGQTWIFTVLATVVSGVIIWQIRRLRSVPWAIFLGLLLGGVLGNLTDRLTRDPGFPEGHVIDFISTPWMMPAIYNIADIGIVVGMGVFILITFLGISIEGGRMKRDEGDATDAVASESEHAGAESDDQESAVPASAESTEDEHEQNTRGEFGTP